MPAKTLQVEVAVPDRLVLGGAAVSVQLPLATGYLGVLPGHAPLLAKLGTGVLTLTSEGQSAQHLAIDGGAVEILPDRVRVLADKAESAQDVDQERAQQALERANSRLQLQSLEIDVDRAQRAVRRARARLAVAEEP